MDIKKLEKEEIVSNIGVKLSDFKIISELGRGSYGVVYKIESLLNYQTYVMKKMELKHMKEKQQKESWKEAMILKKVSHPNIIKYFTSFLEDESLYIIMEYAEEGDLYSLIKNYKKQKKYFPEEELWRFTYEILLGLDYLHTNNIIHRDIKCLNLFLTKDNKIKIGDLGVSKIVSNINALHCTRVGTPLYLAPELIKQIPYDFKVDMWSVGCSLYHLASLDPPFSGDNLIILGNNIVKTKQKNIPNQYSKELCDLIEILLSKKPDFRPTVKEAFEFVPFVIKNEYSVKKIIKSKKDSLVFDDLVLENKKSSYNNNDGNKNNFVNNFSNNFNNNFNRPVSSIGLRNKNFPNNKNNNEIVSVNIPIKEVEDLRINENSKIDLKNDIKKEINITENINNFLKTKNTKINNLPLQNSPLKIPTPVTIIHTKDNISYNRKTNPNESEKIIIDKSLLKHEKEIEKNNYIQNVEDFMLKTKENELDKDSELNNDLYNEENKNNFIENYPNPNNNKNNYKRLLSSKAKNLNNNKFRPNTASNNKILNNHNRVTSGTNDFFNNVNNNNLNYDKVYPNIKSNRPFTALERNINELQNNFNNNVINININVYNVDMNQKFLKPTPSNNLIYINDSLFTKEKKLIRNKSSLGSLPPFSEKDKKSFNNFNNNFRPQTGRLKSNINNNNEKVFTKILKAIENLNSANSQKRNLTINDLK